MRRETSLLRKFGFIVAFLLVISAFTLPSAAALLINKPINGIVNGGFEDGTLEPLWAPVRMSLEGVEKLDSTVASRHMNITEECVHDGRFALKFFNLTEDNETLPYFGAAFHVPMSWLQSTDIIGYRLSLWVSTGDFNDTTVPSPQVLQWALDIGIYCIDENDQVIFYTLWNPSYPITNISSPAYWCDEWKNVVVSIPGDTAVVIIGVDWKSVEYVPSDAMIYMDDVDLSPYTVTVSADRPTYYVGEINLLASISNYEGSPFRIAIEASISKKYALLTPGEFTSTTHKLTVGLKMDEKGTGVYGGFWPVPMRWTLIGPYDATFTLKASFTRWPDGAIHDYSLTLLTLFTVIPLIPIIMSAVLIGTIIVAIVKSKWMSFETFILLILLLIILLY